jgi:hypothetical protein
MNRSASDARTAGINDIKETSQELCDDLPHGAANISNGKSASVTRSAITGWSTVANRQMHVYRRIEVPLEKRIGDEALVDPPAPAGESSGGPSH